MMLVVTLLLALIALAVAGLWFVDRVGKVLLSDERARQYLQHQAEMAAKSLNALPPK